MPKRANVEEVTGELGQLFISERALEMIVYGALLEMEEEGLHPPDRVKGGGGIFGPIARSHHSAVQILRVPPSGGEAPPPSPSEAQPEGGGPAARGGEEPQERKERGEREEREEEKRLKVKLSLVAEYGVPIHKAAEKAIETVRRRVKELAGLDVEEVDVEITGIVRRDS